MKRVMIAAAAAAVTSVALLAGCASEGGASNGQGGSAMKAPEAKKKTPYFEVPSDGQTYVFGSAASVQKYMQAKQLPAMTTHYSKGFPVQVEEAYADALIKEYESQHK